MNKLILFFILMPFLVFGQHEKDSCPSVIDSATHKLVYTFGEQLPHPKEGEQKLILRLLKEFKYPVKSVGGKVHLKFVVDVDGKLSNLTVLKDPSGKEELLGRPLYNLSKKSRWIPGHCNGKRVPMYYDLLFSCIMPSED